MTYLSITKIFHLINSKNLPRQFCTWLLKNDHVNLIENVLIDFLKDVVSTMPFSVSTYAVP